MNPTDEQISNYQAAVVHVASSARVLLQHDIPALLKAIDVADAVGPMFNPTLWRNRREAMMEDRALLTAALPLWRVAKQLEQRRPASVMHEPTVI
jgi:hypothetical protein